MPWSYRHVHHQRRPALLGHLAEGLEVQGPGVSRCASEDHPGPHLEVYWGQQSWDEMYQAFTEYTVESQDLTKPQPSTNDE